MREGETKIFKRGGKLGQEVGALKSRGGAEKGGGGGGGGAGTPLRTLHS